MTSDLLALTSMTASGDGESCECGTLALDSPSQNLPSQAGMTSAFWEGAIGMEGELTGDGRFIEPNALVWDTPMPLRYVPADVGEHSGAQVVGRILTTERRPGGVIWASGDFDMASPIGQEAERHIRERLTNGVSMDLDDVSFEVRVAEELAESLRPDAPTLEIPTQVNEDGTVTLMKIRSDEEIRATTSARIRAATIVAVPAFAKAQIYATEQLSNEVSTVDVTDAVNGMLPNGDDCSTDPDNPRYNPECVPATEQSAPEGVVASAYLVAPPSAWFVDPHFKTASPLTVTKEGRIFGHLAAWGVCHIGMSHQGCVTAPKSRSGYAYFHTGSIVTADNVEVPVGHITLDTTHAPTTGLSAAGAQNHYERTGHVVADVVAGEDAHGIWVSGAVRPGVSASQLRELRAAPLSGDWRRVSGSLELVAALAVNVPGFPIPRPKGLVAGGVVQSLVASGMVPPKQVLAPGTEGALSLDDLRYLKRLAARERQEEQSLQASGQHDAATDLARRVRASELAMRAHR